MLPLSEPFLDTSVLFYPFECACCVTLFSFPFPYVEQSPDVFSFSILCCMCVTKWMDRRDKIAETFIAYDHTRCKCTVEFLSRTYRLERLKDTCTIPVSLSRSCLGCIKNHYQISLILALLTGRDHDFVLLLPHACEGKIVLRRAIEIRVRASIGRFSLYMSIDVWSDVSFCMSPRVVDD